MLYKIYPVFLGTNQMARSNAFLRDVSGGDPLPFHYGMFVLENEDGEKILVESGRPSTAEIHEKGYPFKTVADDPPFPDVLKEFGVVPEEVRTIILTHLHYDHAWNLGMFPNAAIYVQEAEMHAAIAPIDSEKFAYGYFEGTIEHSWVCYAPRMKPLKGETDILPGIKAIPTPGHSLGGQSVLVDTKEGTYAIVGDFALFMENFEKRRVPALSASPQAWFDSHDRLMKLAATGVKILPVHDNCVLERKVYG